MSESRRGFEHAIDKYVESLEQFVQRRRLPQEWFNEPDHLAVKCLDGKHFDAMLDTWARRVDLASYVRMDGRRLAAVHLGEAAISLGMFGSVEWLEIMEPRPEKVGKDTVGIDHAEFVYPDFTAVKQVLRFRKVPYELQENPNHSWVNIPINSLGQELKLNDRPLADIVGHEIETGDAVVL